MPESAYDDANAAVERCACVVLLNKKKKPGFCFPQEEENVFQRMVSLNEVDEN